VDLSDAGDADYFKLFLVRYLLYPRVYFLLALCCLIADC